LGMKNSTFASERAVNPSGGAKSTANDYMNFLGMIMNKGMFNDKRILSEQAINEMQKEQIQSIKIVYEPKVAEGHTYGLGEWILEKDANGNTTSVASPGLFGTWPIIDNKRGYACIVFVKTLLPEQKKEIYFDIKKTIDEAIQP
jgi:CubicO group peptidase (beta-lactamase class C family)